MKKPSFSRVELCLYFLITQGIQAASGKQIHEAGPAASEYFDKLLPPSFFKAKAAILKKNGFTKKSWDEVLNQSRSFYFLPSEATDRVNNEIRELCKNYLMTNGVNYLLNYTHAVLGHKVKVGKVLKNKELRLYSLPENSITTIAMYLKLQSFIQS